MVARWVLILLFCLISRMGFGQGLELAMENGFLQINSKGNLALEYLTSETFQKLDWQEGYAYYLDGSAREYTGLKYNPSKDVILVNTGDSVLPLYPGVINAVSMETEEGVKHIFVIVPLESQVFMEVLSAGKVHFMLHRVDKEVVSEEPIGSQKTFLFENNEKVIDILEKVYVWSPQRGVERIKLSEKVILAMMSDYNLQVQSYIDDNNLKVKKISDAIKVFNYYNYSLSSKGN